jgi:hypothetical protein
MEHNRGHFSLIINVDLIIYLFLYGGADYGYA